MADFLLHGFRVLGLRFEVTKHNSWNGLGLSAHEHRPDLGCRPRDPALLEVLALGAQ